MCPILQRHSERSAVGYLTAKIIDATFIAVMPLLILIHVPLGAAYLNAEPTDAASFKALNGVLKQANLYT